MVLSGKPMITGLAVQQNKRAGNGYEIMEEDNKHKGMEKADKD